MPDETIWHFSYYNNKMEMEFSIAIQAGGKSSRMGKDKGLLEFGGVPLVEYIYNQVKGMSDDIFIVSNDPGSYQQFGLPIYSDLYEDIGALGGIHTVLSFIQTERALILACDMPFVNRDIAEYLMSFSPTYDVVVPRIDERGFV